MTWGKLITWAGGKHKTDYLKMEQCLSVLVKIKLHKKNSKAQFPARSLNVKDSFEWRLPWNAEHKGLVGAVYHELSGVGDSVYEEFQSSKSLLHRESHDWSHSHKVLNIASMKKVSCLALPKMAVVDLQDADWNTNQLAPHGFSGDTKHMPLYMPAHPYWALMKQQSL